MSPKGFRLYSLTILLLGAATVSLSAAPTLEKAFIFGSRQLTCEVFNAPGTNYTVVYQGTPQQLAYDEVRGWGYEVLYPAGTSPFGNRGGYGIFGPFDDSANNRNQFPDTCPSEIYDSFIGAKNFTNECSVNTVGDPETPCAEAGLTPEGIIFRVDVPNGKYRFVAAVGSADNRHAHRIIVEDGGAGPPENLGDNFVVLVDNFDQAEYCPGTFARVGFGCFIPPPAEGPQFVNMDSEGKVTDGPPDSPTLEVTQGYIRVHQLQANSNDGACGTRDANGGDMVILEIWRVDDEQIPPGAFASATRTIDPPFQPPDSEVTITLDVQGPAGNQVTLTEQIPEGYTVTDAGGGTVGDGSLTFTIEADGQVQYKLRTPKDICKTVKLQGEVAVEGGCKLPVIGDSILRCEGALSLTGGVPAFLIIGPIDLGGNAGNNCDDNGNLATTDYIDEGIPNGVSETNTLLEEGDEVGPDFGGAAGGIGVKQAVNPAINPDWIDGILQVWVAQADANGYVNFNLPENIGDPVDDYVVYSLVYVENRTDECRNVILHVGSDDAVKVRLNGQIIHVNPVCRGIGGLGGGDLVPASLQPGVNVMLIAVVERGGGSGVRLRVLDPEGNPITDGSIVTSLTPPASMPQTISATVTRAVDPPVVEAGDTVNVTLTAEGVTSPVTVTETYPPGYTVADDGGGQVNAGENTITFTFTADGEKTYTLQAPAEGCECEVGISGEVRGEVGCPLLVTGDSVIRCTLPAPTCEPPQEDGAQLVAAFAFGVHAALPADLGEWCEVYNDPGSVYTPVEQTDPLSLQYNPDRGWGYEVLYDEYGVSPDTPYGDRGGYEIFGPFDDTANARNQFPDTCPEELYDSFIGAKNFLSECSASTVGDPDTPCAEADPPLPPPQPQGMIFRVDVPNGKYRFVAAVGEPENPHAHRIIAEDGGEGPPENLGNNYVVLVNNFDQAQWAKGETNPNEPGQGVYARVGFNGRIPPPGDGEPPDPQFINMDENGLPTADCPNSPVLEVTQGYIRIHQLQGNSNDGCGGPRDPNGADMVILEIWRVESGPQPTGFKRGDANADGGVNIADAISLLGHLFGGEPSPVCPDAADANDDGALNIADAIKILGHLFAGEGPLPDPFDACGPDPTDDELGPCNYPQEFCK